MYCNKLETQRFDTNVSSFFRTKGGKQRLDGN